MARRGDSVVGIDLGKRVFKGVTLKRKSDSRLVLTSFASREVPEQIATAEELARQIKLLFKDLGGSAKGCALAISDPVTLLRIIEQPDTPVDLLRNALRLNGLAFLNQECKDFVLDVAPVVCGDPSGGPKIESGSGNVAVHAGVATQTKYLVGGMLRSEVKQIAAAANRIGLSAETLEVGPVCS